jgi:uracil-DNA glycosylase
MPAMKHYQIPRFENDWDALLATEFRQAYFQDILNYLNEALGQELKIYPAIEHTYAAFENTVPSKVRVVLIGQDPYHGPGQAHGLSFSVPSCYKTPPSLRNVYKELKQTIDGFSIPNHGNLEAWAKQGVLLLNTILTVEHKKAASHRNIGWAKLTDAVIRKISETQTGIVFMFWGKYAQKKADLVADNQHLILKAAHPSPLARNAFLGCNHFQLANQFLTQQGKPIIRWHLD